jgi:hypothetical protein
VTATDRSGRQLRTVVRWAWLGWEGFGDGAVEVLLPEQSRGVEPRLSGGPQVLRVDAVRGAPDGDVAEQFGADGASWIDPGRPAVRFRGLSSDTRIGCSHRLLNELRLNNANVRGATSVRRNQWSAAEIYLNQSRAPHSPWMVSKRTCSAPSLDPRRSRDGNATIPRSGRCIGTRHAPDQHGGRRRRVRGPATDLRRRADPIVLDLLVLQRHPACARGRFPGVWMVRLRAVQVGLWWR